jgi:hypothetical protein
MNLTLIVQRPQPKSNPKQAQKPKTRHSNTTDR